MHNSKEFSLIIGDVYEEKQEMIAEKAKKWVQSKDHFLDEAYKKKADQTWSQLKFSHEKFQKLILQILKVTNAQFQLLSKVKPIQGQSPSPTPKKNPPSSALVSPIIPLLTQHQQSLFTAATSSTHQKSLLINELSEFSSRFFAITSKELAEFKSFAWQLEGRYERYVADLKTWKGKELRILEDVCVKKASRYFVLMGWQELRDVVKGEWAVVKGWGEGLMGEKRESVKRRMAMLGDCCDGLGRFEELYREIFAKGLTQEITKHLRELVQRFKSQLQSLQKQQTQYQSTKPQTNQKFTSLLQQNQHLFTSLLNQLTIGQWSHILLSEQKKSSFTKSLVSIANSFSSHHNLLGNNRTEEVVHDLSNKQFTVPVTVKSAARHRQETQENGRQPSIKSQQAQINLKKPSQEVHNEQQLQQMFILTLTLDYKLIFRQHTLTSHIFRQFFMSDLKLKVGKQDKHKKIVDERTLVLKDKKTKEYLMVTFEDGDKKEEFTLHWERFEVLKGKMGK